MPRHAGSGQYQDMGVTLFLTPDGRHVISGYLYDEKGKNLSEDYFQKEIYAPLGREMWKKLNAAQPLKEGRIPRRAKYSCSPIRSVRTAKPSGLPRSRG